MKCEIRRNVFETNSSSTHSITMCSDEEWKAWKNGDVAFDVDEGKFIMAPEDLSVDEYPWYSFNGYDKWVWERGLDSFDKTYTTPSGDTVHAFGYCGYDG